jgi:hypothetical protein
MIDIIRDNIQKEFVSKFREVGIDYHTNRAEDALLPYVKLWELNTWSDLFKTHEEMFVRFTFWVWDEAYNTKGNLDLLKEIHNIAFNIDVDGLVNVERDKESFRDAQKPDTKCTVVVYTYKIIRGI